MTAVWWLLAYGLSGVVLTQLIYRLTGQPFPPPGATNLMYVTAALVGVPVFCRFVVMVCWYLLKGKV